MLDKSLNYWNIIVKCEKNIQNKPYIMRKKKLHAYQPNTPSNIKSRSYGINSNQSVCCECRHVYAWPIALSYQSYTILIDDSNGSFWCFFFASHSVRQRYKSVDHSTKNSSKKTVLAKLFSKSCVSALMSSLWRWHEWYVFQLLICDRNHTHHQVYWWISIADLWHFAANRR